MPTPGPARVKRPWPYNRGFSRTQPHYAYLIKGAVSFFIFRLDPEFLLDPADPSPEEAVLLLMTSSWWCCVDQVAIIVDVGSQRWGWGNGESALITSVPEWEEEIKSRDPQKQLSFDFYSYNLLFLMNSCTYVFMELNETKPIKSVWYLLQK